MATFPDMERGPQAGETMRREGGSSSGLVPRSDYCGGVRQLYVGHIDGTTGDTCVSAFRLDDSVTGLRRHRKIDDPVAAAWAGALAAFVLGKILEIALSTAGRDLCGFSSGRARDCAPPTRPVSYRLLRCLLSSPSWGPFGEIAAETRDGEIVIMPDNGSGPTRYLDDLAAPARNPEFAPAAFAPRQDAGCD